MSIEAALLHRTTYKYDRPVQLGPQTIRLRPAPHARTPILSYSLTISPEPHFINWQQDPQGNFLARVVFPERVTHFDVTVDLIADMAVINPFAFFLEPEAEEWPFIYDPVLEQELAPYRRLETPGPLLAALIAEVPRHKRRTIDMLVDLNRRVQERVSYIVRLEPGVWEPERTLTEARGSCRDSAWLLVHALRHLGYAARFVSGYLIQLAPDQKPLEGPAGPTSDFTDLHAWAEAYLPGAGWIGLDATSGLMAGEGHIPLAASPEPMSAAPISGLVEPAETIFDVQMAVTRIGEKPRVTRPYSEPQWQAILDAGAAVDEALVAQDMRLTMGGEPTFVAVADPEGKEWTIDALGPTKRREAGRLMRRLLPLWAPGALVQYGVGKHYPGEQTPRWALTASWRADHEPVWTDPALLADPDTAKGDADAAVAQAFAEHLAGALHLDPRAVIPAYEDQPYYLMREARMPANVVAEAAQSRDPVERARIIRVFAAGLDAMVASVLPLQRRGLPGERRWQTERWEMREGKLFLVPGDLSAGVRLPLASLPWVDPALLEEDPEPDPFEAAGPLPSRAALLATPSGGTAKGVRTALTVQARDGLLYVYLPPLGRAEDWLSLVAAIEEAARALQRPVVLEGYKAPHDGRVLSFSITPDPGVIEVNIHPAQSWNEMVARTQSLYAEARASGLTAEKFMLDGRHIGTGGGNHVVMGAMTPEDSPFLRRPDLLKSLLGFWHNHPSLSYLFSGLFIGPMSQHPRIDEARQDALRELEIAFRQVSLPEADAAPIPPWLVDRLFRNILTDMTGNTHRTEFCIDKLYSPDSPSGRLGLVEFRAFEMPPHPEMAAAQVLLMRAAVAGFWRSPYERRLVRWGTRIHDDFMLPYYVWEDLLDVLEELSAFGVRFDPAWFIPHLEFRFPKIGAIDVHGMHVELRHALEPWHALGETAGISGTFRYVDSSVERLQVRVTGWETERFVLACNGTAVPMAATGTEGDYVAGVRFKAWDPPLALHPTLGAQTPLRFDVYDRWSGRSLGGMTYHVAHPGGHSYATFPVNANEAEARRRARFEAIGHTPGPMPEPVGAGSHEHPRTLDLRAVG